ncbi:MAG: ATP-binding cassette domain-containing protein [Pirellulaceae bacterium]|nr:ATP-binding cassette domain-containing protein [Pirellulaceae bacterium]
MSTTIHQRPFLEVRDLEVRFAQQSVLRKIDLSIPTGQTLAIIGESGCGKTVLLKTLIGLIEPFAGSVIFDGQDMAQLSERQLTDQRNRFGFLFQNAALFDSMSVGENVAFPLRDRSRHDKATVREVVLAKLAEVGLPDDVVYKKPVELSGGMRKRVGLARALAGDPQVLLYDEPTTGLDPIVSDVINELILGTRRNHRATSIIVTHDMRTARKVADRIVMLFPLNRLDHDEPQVIFDGSPAELECASDRRVVQFVRGEAGERLMEMRAARPN